jgi:hypothetical protein
MITEKKKKVSYLLGAGASAQALPLIKTNKKEDKQPKDSEKGLPECLLDFILQHKENWSTKTTNGISTKDPHMVDLLVELEKIALECISFGTPDLYAKFLYESESTTTENYLLIKLLLSTYFYFKQFSDFFGRERNKISFDRRALTFLSTIETNYFI